MKKTFSLILALLMLVSLFASCGEPAVQTPVDESTASEQISSGDTEPALSSEDEDEDEKEATETSVSVEAPEVTLQPSVPSTPDTASQPQTQQPSSQGTQTPVSDPKKPETPASDAKPSQTGSQKGLVPAPGGSVEMKKEMLSEYNILFWGDGFTSANNMGDIWMKFAEADGIKLNFDTMYYDNIGTTSTYNFYEMFNWDGSNADSKITSVKNYKMLCALNGEKKYDYFIMLSGRDRVISQSAGEGRVLTAFDYAVSGLKKVNPGIKVALLVPSGYQKGSDGELIKKIGLEYTDLAGHNKQIKDYAQRLSQKVGGCSMALVCDAFDWFNANHGNEGIDLYDSHRLYPSIPGSYFMACITYSSLFGNATTGIKFDGYLDAQTAETLRKYSDEYLKSTGISLKAHGKDYAMKPMTVEQVDPRNHPTEDRFKNEVYPQYYDELLVSSFAYFQRTDWCQYDNLNMVQTSVSASEKFSRRTVDKNSGPEDATPQHILYTDCSAYLQGVFIDCFNYDFNGANRCNSIFDNGEVLPCRKFYWRQSTDTRTAEQAAADFYASLQPGDLIIFTNESRDGNVGHIMLYLGNGTMIHTTGRHATGGGENYLYANGTDEYEMISGIILDSIDEVGKLGAWLCPFKNKDWLCATFRPLELGLKPTQQAINRLANLRNVVAYKETTAPEGVTVNPGDEVTFTFVIRNDDAMTKNITIQDKLSSGLTFKSGELKNNNGTLTGSVSVPAYSTVRVAYTVTVNNDLTPGRTIYCRNSYLNGVLLNDAPIKVEKTLTADQQAKIVAAADAAGSGAADGIAFVAKAYQSAFGFSLPFANVSDIINKAFIPSVVSDSTATNYGANNSCAALIASNLFGGKKLAVNTMSKEPDRIKHISGENLVPGDILFTSTTKNGSSSQTYLYLGNGILSTVENGKYAKLSPSESQAVFESLLGKYCYVVLRPSQGMK